MNLTEEVKKIIRRLNKHFRQITEITTKEGVFAYLTAETNTTIVTADTYYPIAGVFNNTPMENFDISTDKIAFQGEKSKYFEIDWHATFDVTPSGATIHIGIKKNGVLLSDSIMGSYAAALILQAAGTVAVKLNKGDTIQLVTTSDANGDVIKFYHFTTTIVPFFRNQ